MTDDFIIEKLGDELLVYDLKHHTAHVLEGEVLTVWHAARSITSRRALLVGGLAGVLTLIAPWPADAASCLKKCTPIIDTGRPCERGMMCTGRCHRGGRCR